MCRACGNESEIMELCHSCGEFVSCPNCSCKRCHNQTDQAIPCPDGRVICSDCKNERIRIRKEKRHK